MGDPFDDLLITDCQIASRGDTKDDYGQLSGGFTVLDTVKCRVTTFKLARGSGEVAQREHVGSERYSVFMRPWANGTLTIKHWLLVAGYPPMNIDVIKDPSNLHHHIEVWTQAIYG